ncbi:MAG: GNAT family N-acetyltransferase [candidate division Zixibacteria bacterium]|nr:GNAT family N-acetyltransferase [candidate division Zixibacteria bacterium]
MANEFNLNRPRFLDGERLFLTPYLIEDMDKHFQWRNDYELLFYDGGNIRPKTQVAVKERLERVLKDKSQIPLSIILKESGEHIGLIVIYAIDERQRYCSWGIILDSQYHQKGYGKQAARLIIDYVFLDLGFQRLKSDTHEKNIPSQRLQESLGFVKEGVLRNEKYIRGKYVNDIIYGMIREDYDRNYGK